MEIKKFDDFENEKDYPDLFGENLLRGVQIYKNKYIDDPKNREVKIGTIRDKDYFCFINNYSNIGLQNPAKSIHMFFGKNVKTYDMLNFYGNVFKVIPKYNSSFSFNRELRNGGLGSTWFFVERCLKELLNMKENDNLFQKITRYIGPYKKTHEKDYKLFMELTNIYQKMLIDAGIIGNITYEELLKENKNESKPFLQVWTESPCLHERI